MAGKDGRVTDDRLTVIEADRTCPGGKLPKEEGVRDFGPTPSSLQTLGSPRPQRGEDQVFHDAPAHGIWVLGRLLIAGPADEAAGRPVCVVRPKNTAFV